jgi:hypothetical protein
MYITILSQSFDSSEGESFRCASLVVKALIVRKLVSVLEQPYGILFEFCENFSSLMLYAEKSLLNLEV